MWNNSSVEKALVWVEIYNFKSNFDSDFHPTIERIVTMYIIAMKTVFSFGLLM